MNRERMIQMLTNGIAFDTETHKIQAGLLAPPLVCGSIAAHDGQAIQGEILDKEATLQAFRQIVEDPDRIIVTANGAYDMLVCAVEWAKRGVDMMPAIFRCYEEGRVWDVLIAETLNAIADGTIGKDPRTGGDLRDPISGETTNRYSLAIAVDLTLGRKDAKVNDYWRERYALLENTPIADWPPPARDYPVDDARNTLEVALAQAGFLPKRAEHSWSEFKTEQGVKTACSRCGLGLSFGEMPDCQTTQPHQNLHSMSDQAYTAWALHLGAAWGFTVNQASVDKVERDVREKRERVARPLVGAGLLEWKTEKGETYLGRSTSKVARAVAIAYGATGECETCHGTAKVVSPKAPLIRCRDCRGRGSFGVSACPQCSGTGGGLVGLCYHCSGSRTVPVLCSPCSGTGKVVSDKHKINCQDCRATGLDLATAPQLPCTAPSDKFPNGQVQAKRDVLWESGDDTLGELAEWLEDAKVETNYVPYLRRARIECVGPNGEVYYKSIPLTLKPNVLLETDRTSYADSIQQFPRKGPLRACIWARPGYVFVSVDWNMGESLTHAQSCIWILGYSDLAEALNKGLDPHSSLASQILGLSYEETIARRKAGDKFVIDTRQGAKPATFGKPTGMGSPKLVQGAREQGEDTPCPNGPVWISDGKDGKIRGYRGTRFCILMDRAKRCGVDEHGNSTKVRQWGRPGYERDHVPLCRACLECADRLGEHWLKLWRENRPYFRFASDAVENGQPISPEVAAFLGVTGNRLKPGQVLQHISGIVRGNVGFTDACNGWFQSLLGVAAKLALRRAQRECCDSSVIVPTDACPGGVVSQFAGQRSPLYGSRCVALQHDELLAELLQSQAHEAATRLSEIMVRALQEICPDLAPAVKAPAALMSKWLKGAEPRLDENQRLIPWDTEERVAA